MPDQWDSLLARWEVAAEPVARPTDVPRTPFPGRWRLVLKALRETAGDPHGAVRFHRGGMPTHNIKTTLGKVLRKEGLWLRTKEDNEHLIAWVEEIPDLYLQRGMKERGGS